MSDTNDSLGAQLGALGGWHTRYPPSLKEHIYALGVVAANFNHLEFTLLALFYNFLGLDEITARYLFTMQGELIF
jgi:hypothetical protein